MIPSASFDKEREDPPGVANGILSLYYGDKKVGEGLCVGQGPRGARHGRLPGTAPYRFTGGTIRQVQVNVRGKPYVDLEREAVAMMSRE